MAQHSQCRHQLKKHYCHIHMKHGESLPTDDSTVITVSPKPSTCTGIKEDEVVHFQEELIAQMNSSSTASTKCQTLNNYWVK